MKRPTFSWHLHWPLTLLALALLPVLLAFGFWQLQRADEKRVAQAAFDVRSSAPPSSLSQLDGQAPDYTRLRARGHFDNAHSFLLDNRVLDGRVGFEVITPLQLEGEARRLLVNRGWIEGDSARRVLPAVPPVAGDVELEGYLYRDAEGFRLGADAAASGWPHVVQGVRFEAMAQLLGAPLFGFTLRLDVGQPGALRPHWPIVNLAPEQHIGYAVQWFAMSATLVLAWLLANSNLWQWLRGAHGHDDPQ